MTREICGTHAGVRLLEADGDMYFLYDPDADLPPERQLPFATIVTGNRFDTISELDRPDVYRLNIGLTKTTYTERYATTTGDYTALDTVLPHPTYGAQHWVCVLNPGPATLETVRALLVEAHTFAARKYDNHRACQNR